MKNFYEILEVPNNAGFEDIKKSYRRLSKKYHPDMNKGDKSVVEKFKKIAEAYNTLSNAELRQKYDEKLNSSAKRDEPDAPKNYSDQTDRAGFNFDPADVERQFEKFFGFDPKTKEKKANFAGGNQAKKNPIDTSHIFESFFNVKKK